MEEAHGKKPVTCGACGKKFPFESRLKKHQRLFHLGEKDFKCLLCEKAFSTRQGLQIHSAKHFDARPFTCEYCWKTFKIQKVLGKHMKLHLNEARYICRICENAFITNDKLNNHMKQAHPNADSIEITPASVPIKLENTILPPDNLKEENVSL